MVTMSSPNDLTPERERLLEYLSKHEPISANALAKVLGRTQPTVRAMLLKLEAGAYVLEDASAFEVPSKLNYLPHLGAGWRIHPRIREALGLAPLTMTPDIRGAIEGTSPERRACRTAELKERRERNRKSIVEKLTCCPKCKRPYDARTRDANLGVNGAIELGSIAERLAAARAAAGPTYVPEPPKKLPPAGFSES